MKYEWIFRVYELQLALLIIMNVYVPLYNAQMLGIMLTYDLNTHIPQEM